MQRSIKRKKKAFTPLLEEAHGPSSCLVTIFPLLRPMKILDFGCSSTMVVDLSSLSQERRKDKDNVFKMKIHNALLIKKNPQHPFPLYSLVVLLYSTEFKVSVGSWLQKNKRIKFVGLKKTVGQTFLTT